MAAAELKQLFEQYLAETISEADFKRLWSTLEKPENDAEWFTLAEELLHNENLHGLSDPARENAALLKLREHLIHNKSLKTIPDQQPIVHRIHFLKTGWFKYAAAIILILGAGFYLWFSNSNGKTELSKMNNSTPPKADVAPGSNKALLTLADGTKIILDNIATGNIAQQGNTKIIKLDAGQLAYNTVAAVKASSGDPQYNTISTPRGGQYQIILPDGSRVWLNAASSIKFPTAFTGSERKVEMTGEAYMEIEKNPKQPFVVKANGMEIQVLGTSFNVNDYSDENAIKTTLIDGSVKVISNAHEVILKPSQQALINTANENPVNPKIRLITVQTTNLEQVLAWKNGTFQFNRTPLEAAMRQLARWYDVEVVYDKMAPNIKFSGDMKRDLTLSQVLDALGEVGVRFRIEGKKLIVL